MRIVVTVVVACSLGGCSWVLQERLPAGRTAQELPRCTGGRGLAVVDGLWAALDVSALVSATQEAADPPPRPLIGIMVVDALVHVASGVTGVHWATQCREARTAYEQRLPGPPPPVLAPPPPVLAPSSGPPTP